MRWVNQWVGSCVWGVMCVKGHDMGGGHVFVGPDMGGVMYGVTHLILAPPILGRVPYVQNSLLDKVSAGGRVASILTWPLEEPKSAQHAPQTDWNCRSRASRNCQTNCPNSRQERLGPFHAQAVTRPNQTSTSQPV